MHQSEKNRLFEKYLKGDLTLEERHLLEKYALDDDFIYDAMEGVSLDEKRSRKAVDQIGYMLEKRKQSRKQTVMIWLSLAAGVAVLILALIGLPDSSQEAIADVVQVEETSTPKLEGVPLEESDQIAAASVKETGKIEEEMSQADAIKSEKPVEAEARIELAQESETELERQEAIEVKSFKKELIAVEELEDIEIVPTLSESRPTISAEPKRDTENELAGMALDQEASDAVTMGSEQDQFMRNSNGFARMREMIASVPSAKTRLFVEVENDEATTLLLSTYLQDAMDFDFKGDFVAEFEVLEKDKTDSIRVAQSVDPQIDEKIRKLIEGFGNWEHFGNKKVLIRFNDQ
ncbi:hypothetical protein [Portibacter marinus]|uniref:hypothetical protein n=1 Tax=Portibacter marinus TaxID=2898660 RepID=UPI001F38444B|nr:hypothetical protein [Portibacter marinus]